MSDERLINQLFEAVEGNDDAWLGLFLDFEGEHSTPTMPDLPEWELQPEPISE